MTVAETSDVSLTMNRTLNAPRDQVFQAWTDADIVSQWFAPRDDVKTIVHELDLRVGGRYRFEMLFPDPESFIVSGEYVEIDSPNRLIFTWAWDHQKEDQTLVTVDFNEIETQTELVLTHEQFPDKARRDLHGEGWVSCLARLVTLYNH